MRPYRSLIDGILFGLSMLTGAIICGLFFGPGVTFNPSGEIERAAWAAVAGAVAGGAAWKLRRLAYQMIERRIRPMQFRLRTLLIVLAIGPPIAATAWCAVQHALAKRCTEFRIKITYPVQTSALSTGAATS